MQSQQEVPTMCGKRGGEGGVLKCSKRRVAGRQMTKGVEWGGGGTVLEIPLSFILFKSPAYSCSFFFCHCVFTRIVDLSFLYTQVIKLHSATEAWLFPMQSSQHDVLCVKFRNRLPVSTNKLCSSQNRSCLPWLCNTTKDRKKTEDTAQTGRFPGIQEWKKNWWQEIHEPQFTQLKKTSWCVITACMLLKLDFMRTFKRNSVILVV